MTPWLPSFSPKPVVPPRLVTPPAIVTPPTPSSTPKPPPSFSSLLGNPACISFRHPRRLTLPRRHPPGPAPRPPPSFSSLLGNPACIPFRHPRRLTLPRRHPFGPAPSFSPKPVVPPSAGRLASGGIQPASASRHALCPLSWRQKRIS